MKTIARVLLTLILVTAGCAGGYQLWDYYMLSPWTRDARVQADVVSIARDGCMSAVRYSARRQASPSPYWRTALSWR